MTRVEPSPRRVSDLSSRCLIRYIFRTVAGGRQMWLSFLGRDQYVLVFLLTGRACYKAPLLKNNARACGYVRT